MMEATAVLDMTKTVRNVTAIRATVMKRGFPVGDLVHLLVIKYVMAIKITSCATMMAETAAHVPRLGVTFAQEMNAFVMRLARLLALNIQRKMVTKTIRII